MPVPRTSSKIVDRTGRRLLPIGSEDFAEVVTEHVYVDKTSLICDLLDSSYKVTLLCRPCTHQAPCLGCRDGSHPGGGSSCTGSSVCRSAP